MMIAVYPSILEKNSEDLNNYLIKLLPFFNYFQLDIADGKFVSNSTLTLQDLTKMFAEFNAEKDELSIKVFEIHLMVEDLHQQLKAIAPLAQQISISRVIVHFEALAKQNCNVEDLKKLLGSVSRQPIALGLSINPDTTIEKAYSALEFADAVQLMTVYPGMQGSPFVPGVLNKIKELRERGYEKAIILDGAMNDTTLAQVLKKKDLPTAICPGSYFKEDTANKLEKLQKMIEKANHTNPML